MAREKCKKEHCEKDAISFSDFCGEHSDVEAIVEALNSLEEVEYDNLFLEDIVLEGIQLKDIELNFMNLIDVELENCTFEDCRFYCANLVNTEFVNCAFINGEFEEATDFQSSNFHECKLKGLKFKEVDFNQAGFMESTIIEDCHFENSNLIGDLFHTMEIHRTTFHLVHINQSSFHKCFFNQSKILDSNIYKTAFWDTSFVECELKNIVNDFAELNDPIALCLFLETTIENTYTPDDFAKWNGVNVEPYLFYRSIIENLQDAVQKYALDSVENLSVVKDTLNRLSQIGEPEPEVKRAVTNIFSQYFNLAKEQKDLDAFGNIATYFSQMPQEWLLNIGQFLPSPQEIGGESTLRLHFQTIGLSLAKATNIFRKLDGLEILFVGEQNRSAQIRDIQVGSIIIEIGSNIETIVLLVYVLISSGYKGINLYLDFQKKVRGNKKLKLEIAEKQKALNPPQQQESELEALQKEKLEQEIKLLKLQQFQLLSEMTGVKPEEILGASVMKQAKQLGQTLANEAEQLDLYVNIAEEDTTQLPPPMPPPEY